MDFDPPLSSLIKDITEPITISWVEAFCIECGTGMKLDFFWLFRVVSFVVV